MKKFLEIATESKALIAGFVSSLTALIGLVILYRNNTELFLLVLIAIFWAGIIAVCVYLIKAQTQSEVIGAVKKHKFPRARKWAIFCLLFLPVFTIGSFLLKPVQNFTSIAIYGTPTLTPTLTPVPTITPVPNKPNIKTILIGSKDNINTIEITFHNPLMQELIVTHINVKVTEDAIPEIYCYCPFPNCGEFTVSNQISLTGGKNGKLEFTSGITRETGLLSSYMFPANGLVFFGCGFYGIELDFDTSLIIPADEYYFFLLNVPSSFEVSASNMIGLPLEKEDLKRVYFPLYSQPPKHFWLAGLSPSEIELTTVVELTLDTGEVVYFALHQ